MQRRTIAAAVATALLAAGFAAGCARGGKPAGQPATWPLTGKEAPSSDAIRTRVVSVKIENADAARPQTGLAEADVIYETLAEGGITRFNALFHSQAPDRLGPVRSARLSDLYVVGQYRALFAWSGANKTVIARIDEADIDDVGVSVAPRAYERISQRAAPHNLYSGIPALRDAGEDEGYPTEVDPPRLAFGDAPDDAGSPTTEVTIAFHANNVVTWRWDADRKAFLREINGQPHTDTTTEEPYEAANVIVLTADTIEGEKPGTTDIVLSGSGDAVVLRDGKRYEGAWSAGDDTPPVFETKDGTRIPLADGPTWIEVVSSDISAEFAE